MRLIAPPRRAELAAAAVLLLAVVVTWAGALSGPFQFDDWNVIVDRPAVHSLAAWWHSMPGIRPLLKLSYALNWSIAPEPFGFHLTNLFIHAFNVLLVWQLLRHWPQLSAPAAWWAASLFALHPVQAEAVTYISGRSMALMSTFWLLAAWSWWRGVERDQPRWRHLAVLALVLALLVRETAVTLPLALWFWRVAQGARWRTAARELRPLWWTVLLTVLALLALPRYRELLALALQVRPPLENLGAQAGALVWLLGEPLWLLQNNIDPLLPTALTQGVGAWVCGAAVLVMAGLGLAGLRRYPLYALALLWPLLMLWPMYSLIPRFDPLAERHLYLALLGPAVAVVALVRRVFAGRWAGLVLLPLALGLGWATIERNHDYRSESALWQVTAAQSPRKPRVWNNLGYAWLVEGRPELAVPAFRRAIELDADFLRAQVNLERAEALLVARQAAQAMRR